MAENKSIRAQKEEKILAFWKDNEIFQKTLEKESPEGEFVFYEGPPTANGRPGIHHLEARAFKDAIPRYKTMQGYHVPRKGGWDTHGLPVELEVEKQLGLKSKKEIENYGVAKFNDECKKSVWKYVNEWSDFTDRVGYWVDLENAYKTYDNSYIEKVWSIISHVNKRDLLYKDYKVIPWCPRCGTGLSSHELGQPGAYQDDKDLSVYAKFKVVGEENLYLLAWTTTPWTLPGNVALAVGEDIDYLKVKILNDLYILAESRLEIIQEEHEVVKKMKGKELLELEYEPLYPYLKENLPENEKEKLEKAYKVYSAPFVTTEDGTGIVHTAVMYGQDDFVLGTQIGLPKFHLVDETGHFKKEVREFSGMFVKDEETAVAIIKDLAHRGLLFRKEKHTHSYPHCWRCKTPLIYYARDSWYIRMSDLRHDLVKENEKINWEPEYIKEGRFGEWLREVKDWAISRERYWGTPLPVWENKEGTKKYVIGSVDDLRKHVKKSGNKYLVMRHGGTDANLTEIVSYKNQSNDHLTENGRKEALKTSKEIDQVDLIISSPFARTKETAEIVADNIGYPKEKIIYDDRIQEVNPGEFDGRNWNEYHKALSNADRDWFKKLIPDGESLAEVRKRIGEFLYELEDKYQDKKILIVTHGGPAWVMYVVSGLFTPENKPYRNLDDKEADFVSEFKRFQNGELRELPFVPLPHDENFAVDLHKPFIDQITLLNDEGEELKRVKEVMDVWLDSGSMPFASFEDEDGKHYPADFISEAIDQTRGWFYTLHAVGVLMEKGRAFKNVICLGHLLDKEGRKMSKSIGNVVDPWEMIDKYGVDLLRLWMYSVNQPGESKNFDEKTVDELGRKTFNLLENVYSFYSLYRDRELESNEIPGSQNPLDNWILARLSDLNAEMTESLDSYKLLEPVRGIRDFIDDLSTWYLRRSRDRIKEGDKDAKVTLYFVLKTISKLLAPFAPFAAESLYQDLRFVEDKESVHLEDWPNLSLENEDVLVRMKQTRNLVSKALEIRAKENIKVRQPLQSMTGNLKGAFVDLIKEEINVKEVIDRDIEEVLLDTTLSSELIEEGKVREIIRVIQDERKERGLKPADKIDYPILENDKDLILKYKDQIEKSTGVNLVF